MAASGYPPGAYSNGNIINGGSSNSALREDSNGGSVSATENSTAGPPRTTLRHNPGLSLDWTPEEQSTLADLLKEYASSTSISRYALISEVLRDKTVRDVALRCKWMSKKENGKRRKFDRNSRKIKKEKVTDSLPKSSQFANRSNGPHYVQSMMAMDSDDGISYQAIGGATGHLLEQNAQALDQISVNFSTLKIHENFNLLCQARANIFSILNDCHDLPEIMKQMPPLPVKLNEDLAQAILPPSSVVNR